MQRIITARRAPLLVRQSVLSISRYNSKEHPQLQSSLYSTFNVGDFNEEFNRKEEPKRPRAKYAMFYIAILASTTTVLGLWQTRRLIWKKQLISSREQTLNGEPLQMTQIQQENIQDEDLLYKKVTLTGYFLNGKTCFVGVRQSPIQKRLGLPTSTGETGYYVITPFVTSNNEIVYVNRGWIPKSMKDSFQQSLPETSPNTDILAVVREYEIPSVIAKENYKVGNDLYIVMDPMVMAEHTGLKVDHPMFLDQLEEGQKKEGYMVRAVPQDFLKFYVTPETHIAYMTVWFGLTAWILGAAYMMRRRGRW